MKTNNTERLLIKQDGNIEMKSNAVYFGESGDSQATIFMSGGATGDPTYEHSVIETRQYGTTDNSELLLFKGNDHIDFSDNTDRIRLRSGEISIDCLTENTTDRTSNENIIAKFNSNGLLLDGVLTFDNVNSIPTQGDGCLFRYGSQFYLMVDDNFYIQDTGYSGNPQFQFSTDTGFKMYKGANTNHDDDNAHFKVNSDGSDDRVVIHQIEDGGGGYWYWNRSFHNGKSSDERLKENIQDIADEDIDFLMRMRPKKYKLKGTDTDCCHYGLIAQEVLAECQTMHQRIIVNNADDYLADSNTEKM